MKKIALHGLYGSGKFTEVNDERFDYLNQRRWTVRKNWRGALYVVSRLAGEKWKTILMSRLITNCPSKMKVDHINGDTLNNQDNNLRICTQQQNTFNRRKTVGNSKYKGVCWSKSAKKWIVSIMKNYNSIHLGSFTNEIEAAKAYDKKARELFGEFALTNFK